MEKGCRYERISPESAEEILAHVLEFRDRYDQHQKPDDVNTLLSLFPRVSLREGFMLDYVLINTGEAVQRILPFARPCHDDAVQFLPPHSGEEEEEAEQAVETLYQYLDYERTPQGLFEYAFFVTELWSTRVSWHAAEWLSSTPVFTQERFDQLFDAAKKANSLSRPEWYGPEAGLGEQGGAVRFLVYTQMGWKRIYYLEIGVRADGRTDMEAGDIVADFGQGIIF